MREDKTCAYGGNSSMLRTLIVVNLDVETPWLEYRKKKNRDV